ncbi:hypothetical protein [uncultured Paludibaculum sp.]|uniref:hypothetical protein n=1 Tax=uncultured Paludibaculum sp. TaxID=1765020 RepID=UPI002AAB9117|nr:hypothetical protein [uncultured Paludibaculum sp.]
MRRLMLILSLAGPLAAQRFYSDDPLGKEPAPRPVGDIRTRKLSDYYDLFSNQFGDVGERQPKQGTPIPAAGVNTLGEPMDGSWYQKRHYYRRMTREELVRGPGNENPPSTSGKWTIIAAKEEGVTPGFAIVDSEKRTYFVKFDPPKNPEMATAADSIGARFFYALGYHVPENYIIQFRADRLQIGAGVQVEDGAGRKRPMTPNDLERLLAKVSASSDGQYRATASRSVSGKPIGPPRYHGTRSDDPNDIVPHEHLRALRGLQVFCAWLDHDDSRAINNLDAVVTENGVSSVRHYLLDFGSTLGSATQMANSPRSGDYFFTWKTSAVQLFTLGLKPPYWAFARYPDYPSVGRFESKIFDPEKWVPEYPNPSFINRLPDDEFWAAKQVMAFTDQDIDTIVGTGQLSDAKAAAYLAQCLKERRDKIGQAYFAKVLPFDRFRTEGDRIAWDDLSKLHGFGVVAGVQVSWSRLDNRSGTLSPIIEAKGERIPQESGYLAAELSTPSRPKQRMTVFLRRSEQGTEVVGLERTW